MDSDAPFTVTCTGGFEDGVWIIKATLRFRDGRPDESNPLLAEGRLVMLQLILREGMRGDMLGASAERIFLDDHTGELVEIDPDRGLARFPL